MKRLLILTLALGLTLALAPQDGVDTATSQTLSEQARQSPARFVTANPAAPGALGTGATQYDEGNPDGRRKAGPVFTFLGNRFDTQNGQPFSPGTVGFGLFPSPGTTGLDSINVNFARTKP